ncbi:DUF551 domain-containing protein [Marinobacter shengliensis]|uniref:DUF551 domain-containing protein n=1 Tax=Marinobacter shengliensis TaxID=1389223 RepID=UPI001E398BBC|nr:DUF551 domain-containing protein [Marinobacter shengliensis]MCD1628509.1 DUF551 domain-containing protein [Marinobacter shengliensis]
MTDFVWPSDRTRAENDELNRVCEYLEEVLDAQSGQGAEPVTEADAPAYLWDKNSRYGWAIGMNSRPQPAQQGGVPEEAVSLARKWLGITESGLLHNDDITKMAEALLATSQPTQPAQQGSVPGGQHISGHVREHLEKAVDGLLAMDTWQIVKAPRGDLKRYNHLRNLVREILELPDTPQQEGEGWVKCSERLPTEAGADSEGNVWFCWPDGDMRLVHYKKIQLPYHSEHHWMSTGLKRPQPPQEGE